MPTTKQFCDLLMQPVREKWGYVWGLNGELYTQAMANSRKANKRSTPRATYKTYWTEKDHAGKWIGKMAADCSGLIVWALRKLGTIAKTADLGSAAIIGKCKKQGLVKNGVPNVDGLILYRPGHVAVLYKGKVLEAKGTDYGVVYGVSKVSSFTTWGYYSGLQYEEPADTSGYKDVACVTKNGGTVNIRKAPATSSDILGKVVTGQKFKAKPPTGDWCEVMVGNIRGYMHKNYIKF